MWGPRLRKSVEAVGHQPIVFTKMPAEIESAEVAIINLSSTTFPPNELVPRLKEAGIRVIAHAGHKEKDMHRLGSELGCDQLVTNSQLTFKLSEILKLPLGRGAGGEGES